MTTEIKTVDVNVKEWFDRVNGNSYFAGSVTTNYGLSNQKTYPIPFQYGYGDHYRDKAFQLLQDEGVIPKQEKTIHWRYYKENGIIARYNKQENCRKKDLKSI